MLSKTQYFIDSRTVADRQARRVFWCGSTNALAALSQNSQLKLPSKNEILRAMSKADDREISGYKSQLFSICDQLIRFPAGESDYGSISFIPEKDYAIYMTKDSGNELAYVAVMADDKVLLLENEKHSIQDLGMEQHRIFELPDDSLDAKRLRAILPDADELVSLERLSGKRLQEEAPLLNAVVQNINEGLGLKSIEIEFRYKSMDTNTISTEDLGHLESLPVCDEAHFRHYQDLGTNPLVPFRMNLMMKDKQARVRINLDENSNIQSLNILNEPFSIQEILAGNKIPIITSMRRE